jgi:hypothetical protein
MKLTEFKLCIKLVFIRHIDTKREFEVKKFRFNIIETSF